ncbi:adenylate/guanylate cyclase domain-containing protein [Agrobacterium larrymoorei]|uniref:Adenylate/guanylate cyclase domain-containing protein n=1 Tax=Agrobacterium larrymoorei TaxID=160699 RepID=A0AAF0HC90_9HYPH|nr:adenylate/guanylate cyclase domain-containing protein [Agrobacterium larrymoorei]QYA09558.1 adenylate/guanylate cyclase domain-containing protein [Agrobacterium larrymoorei]WHA43027.1 adenylate/guanylate cyclase domain-containing protein [Agrobacterium larrymoorei]
MIEQSRLQEIAFWLSQQGYEGTPEEDLLSGFCEKCNAIGVSISSALILMDTLHPDFEGHAFQWDSRDEFKSSSVYDFTDEGTAREDWESSVFFHLIRENAQEIRRRLHLNEEANFYKLDELRNAGHTDYIAAIHRFTERGSIGEMSAFYSRWLTRHPEGFHDDELAALRMLLPTLALAVKTACCMRIIGTITDVYLGRDAGRKVMSGTITRGEVERIDAVLWFSDLRDFTGISDRAEPDQIIPFLNDYAGLVIDAVHAHGGSVLKLIGDGVLAIFRSGDQRDDCAAALAAEMTMRTNLSVLNNRRRLEGLPTTDVYLGLHVGEVFYGNIGSRNRLDFTVVGPAVNMVSRIEGLCGSVDRDTVMSKDFAAMCPAEMRNLMVSIGRYALRGFARAHELFTIDPELA